MIYLFDANVISDILTKQKGVAQYIVKRRGEQNELLLCSAIYYEVMRGLLWRNATRRLELFQDDVMPFFEYRLVAAEDWRMAAQLWADTRSRGKQFSDSDLLLAAMAKRLNAVIVSSDQDFDALAVTREDWRDVSE